MHERQPCSRHTYCIYIPVTRRPSLVTLDISISSFSAGAKPCLSWTLLSHLSKYPRSHLEPLCVEAHAVYSSISDNYKHSWLLVVWYNAVHVYTCVLVDTNVYICTFSLSSSGLVYSLNSSFRLRANSSGWRTFNMSKNQSTKIRKVCIAADPGMA